MSSNKIPINLEVFLSLGYGRSKTSDWSNEQLSEMVEILGLPKKGNKQTLYDRIGKTLASNPRLVIEISRPSDKHASKNTYDCYKLNRPLKDGTCRPDKPYMRKTKNNNDCCYAKPTYASIKRVKHEMGEQHDDQIKRLVKGGYLRRSKIEIIPGVNMSQAYGVKDYKIIIYDLETSGLPKGKTFPDITQIAMYAPQTDEYYMSYVKPSKPIDAEASEITGIYGSFNDHSFRNSKNYQEIYEKVYPSFMNQMKHELESFDLGRYLSQTGILNMGDMSSIIIEHIQEYKNLPPGDDNLLHFASVVENDPLLMTYILSKIPPQSLKRFENIARQTIEKEYILALHDFVTLEVVDKHHVVSLDNERPFIGVADEIRDFIIKDTSSSTIILMIAHNGQAFDEPVLKDSYNHIKRGFYLSDNIMFVDSYLMSLMWLSSDQIENYKLGTLYKKFIGEDMPGWHDAKADVTGLWKMIEGLFLEVWGTKDHTFIVMKMIEFYFSSQLMDEDYLEQVANRIFFSEEESDIYKKTYRLSYGKYHEAP